MILPKMFGYIMITIKEKEQKLLQDMESLLWQKGNQNYNDSLTGSLIIADEIFDPE